ncbi:MAG: hypothetical protein KDE27_17180 [Planctomycetes bacterium]|nr:hypothetical protein [Planctomycetota bacterium]
MRSKFLHLCLPLGLAAAATAQTCLTTTFAGGNAGGNPNNVVYYTVDVIPAPGVTLTSMDLNLDSVPVSTQVECEIYARFGSGHAGNEALPGWHYVTRASGTMAGINAPTTMTFNSTFWLPMGTNAVAVVATGGAKHVYTNGNGTNQTASNADLMLTLGTSSNAPFTTAIFTPRVANTTLCYNIGGLAAYADFRAGTPTGGTPLMVSFTDNSWTSLASGISLWQWDFDNDGTFEVSGSGTTEQNPTWVYGFPGTYSVKLQIVDGSGATSLTRTDLIKVGFPTNNANSADLLHYTFNEPPRPGEMRVFNAASSDIAPRFATMTNDNWQGDAARPLFQGNETGFGCLGEAGVVSMNALDTGWPLQVTNMTVSWWHRVGTAGAGTSNAFAYVFGGPGSSQRCYTDGTTIGPGVFRYDGTGIGAVTSLTDVKTSYANVWTHMALVVDDDTGTATWYVNGVPDGGTTFTPGSHSVARSEFWVGYHSGTQNYSLFYSMDDFRMYSRALTPTEITALAAGTEPAVGAPYGVGCPGASSIVPTVGASGGPPTIGNTSFAIQLADAEPGTLAGLVFGLYSNRQTAAGGALPLDLQTFNVGFASGCGLEIGGILTTVFRFQAGGTANVGFAIPNSGTFTGLHFYSQWGVLGSVYCVSDALDIAIK